MLSDQEPDSASQGDSAKSHRSCVAEPRGQPDGVGLVAVFGGGETGVGPCGHGVDVDFEGLEAPQIDNDSAIGGAVSGGAVPATADGELDTGLPGDGQDRRYVAGVCHLSDRGGADAVVDRCEESVGVVVPIIFGCEKLSFQGLATTLDVEIGSGCDGHRLTS